MYSKLETRIGCQIFVMMFVVFCFQIQYVDAQDANNSIEGNTFGDPVESVWEFGLKINSTGNSRRITASVPIPMSWPEQEVEILREIKTQNVGKFQKKNPTKHTRQFRFNVNRISGRVSSRLRTFSLRSDSAALDDMICPTNPGGR